MTSLLIRLAEVRNAASLAEPSAQLGYPSTESELVDRLSSVLTRDDHLVLGAESAAKLVGWLHAFMARRVESPPFAEIGGLMVARSARGHGIGRQLVFAATQWARIKGVHEIRVRSNVVRKEAHDFYFHIGFKHLKAQTVFSLDVGASDGPNSG